jgi:5-formyltetrahydrofolate cyclo-ligase
MGEQVRLAKSELRRRILAARRERSADLTAVASRAICDQIERLIGFQLANHLVAYAACPGEIDPSALVESGIGRGCPVYFPRVIEAGLEFLAAWPGTLRAGAFGVAEPQDGPRLSPESPGITFLVPGLTFDGSGARLGRGGGHYDRALAGYPGALRLGLVLDADLAATVPCDTWDQRVDAVVTERRLLWAPVRRRPFFKESVT